MRPLKAAVESLIDSRGKIFEEQNDGKQFSSQRKALCHTLHADYLIPLHGLY